MLDHWLIGVAKKAGLDTSALSFAPTEALATVWSAIVNETGVSAEDLAQHVAQRFRLPVADLNDISAAALALVPENAVRQFGVLPLRQNNREIHLATSDPTEIEVEQAIGFVSARSPQFEIAPPDALRAAIERHYGAVVAADPVLRAAATTAP